MNTALLRLQWKGTQACADFFCICGAGFHYDGMFMYTIKCSSCGRVYECQPGIGLTQLDTEPPYTKLMTDEEDDVDRPWFSRTETFELLDADEALPCPFCGHHMLHIVYDHGANSYAQIRCRSCKAKGPDVWQDRATVIEAWNARQQDQAK